MITLTTLLSSDSFVFDRHDVIIIILARRRVVIVS